MVLVGLAVGSMVILSVLRFSGTVVRLGGEDTDQVLALYAAQTGVTNVVRDLMQGQDALAPGYSPPTSTINELPVDISVSAPITSTQPAALHQYIDPGVGFGLASLPAQTSYYFTIESVGPGAPIRVNWTFTPARQRWRMRIFEGGGPPTAPAPVEVAADNFESGTLDGGSGWNAPWSALGDASVTSTGNPTEGSFHMRLTGTAEAKREVDTSTSTDLRLQFWAKTSSFAPGETATLSVSSNGVDFTSVRTWADGEDDNVYRYEDIDLSSFATSTGFVIRFKGFMSGVGDLFFIDDLRVVIQNAPSPIVENADIKGPGALLVDGSAVLGGKYTIEFFNNAGTELVSGPFSTTGAEGATWVYAQGLPRRYDGWR